MYNVLVRFLCRYFLSHTFDRILVTPASTISLNFTTILSLRSNTTLLASNFFSFSFSSSMFSSDAPFFRCFHRRNFCRIDPLSPRIPSYRHRCKPRSRSMQFLATKIRKRFIAVFSPPSSSEVLLFENRR